jgi:endonuclease-3
VPSEYFSKKSARFAKILSLLKKTYQNAKCSLNYKTPIQLLVATILSAQCTDARVNKTTPALFAKYKTAKDFANANPKELQSLVRSCGFYRNKAKNIIAACKMIDKEFGGALPCTMEQMLLLPGVARKTANIVLGNAYGILEGIPVDTHAIRLSGRLAISSEHDPNKIELDLRQIVPREDWLQISNLFVHHGRALCMAKNPKCNECPLFSYCPYGRKNIAAKGKK